METALRPAILRLGWRRRDNAGPAFGGEMLPWLRRSQISHSRAGPSPRVSEHWSGRNNSWLANPKMQRLMSVSQVHEIFSQQNA